jgi:hypothetical protein
VRIDTWVGVVWARELLMNLIAHSSGKSAAFWRMIGSKLSCWTLWRWTLIFWSLSVENSNAENWSAENWSRWS